MRKKWYKKINRGAILTFLVILGVIVYLISLSMVHNAAKPEIEKITRDYIDSYMRYAVVPENIRTLSDDKQLEALEKYTEQMQKELAEFYPEGEHYKSLSLDLEVFIKDQVYRQEYTEDLDYNIVRFMSYRFEDKMVTVEIQSRVSSKDEPVSEVEDQIMLLKEKDGWEIVYASISLTDSKGDDGPFPDMEKFIY